jgi:GT2 family glycosyltransferase
VIPSLIVPVLNRPDLLDRLLASIHYEVGDLLVIDNGNVVKSLPHIPGVHRSHLIKSPTNLGVPASWNLGIKMLPFATYWMVVNSDAYFPRTSMNRLAAAYRYDALVLSGAAPEWACFMVGQQVVSKVGLFDEGIYPAYFEDNDYERRCTYHGFPVVRSGIAIGHDNSSTINSDPKCLAGNSKSFPVNRAYYEAKTGRGDFSEGRWSLATRRALSWD